MQSSRSLRPSIVVFCLAAVVLVLFAARQAFRKPAARPGSVTGEVQSSVLPSNDGPSTASLERVIPESSQLRSAGVPRHEENPEGRQIDSIRANELLGQLAQVQVRDDKLTTEQGRQIQSALRELAAKGPAALPAIRQFLERNQDLSFGQDGSKLAGVPSLRAGVVDALGQIGGPESLALSRQVLQAPTQPLEVALAARNLEAAAPGQYTQESVEAAREILSQAAAGKVDLKDPAPLFQVLETYGDSSAAADLQKLVPNWNYYATMALAGLPSGQGIASLIQLAQPPATTDAGPYNKLPLQMLAQLSAQYPDASSAVLEMARQNQIPDSAWSAVATGLGGPQFGFIRQLPQNTLPQGGSIQSGSSAIGGPPETFYGLPIPSSSSDIPQRVALIDQLLATVSSNPAAVQALNQAREHLATLMGHG